MFKDISRARTFDEPTLDESVQHIQDGLARKAVITVIGACRVEYEGRASSKLDLGERIVIIKSDGSLLVHRPVGYEPINWQPSGCHFLVEKANGEIKIRATRTQPRETVHIFFKEIYIITYAALVDVGEFVLHLSELDLKNAVLAEPSLVEVGFVPLSSEKELNEAGFVDVFGQDKDGNFVVLELKRVPAGPDAILQLERYINRLRKRISRHIRGIIAAPELKREAQPLLSTLGFEFKPISLRKCYEIIKKTKMKKLSDFFEA